MKWRLLVGTVITLCSLTACQTTQLSASAIHQPQSITSLIAEKTDQPNLYFDQDGQYSSTPVKDGFYRKVLGKTRDGGWVAQDFYQNSKTKQVDPFVIFRTDGLRDFSSEVVDGVVIWYRLDGSREASTHFVRGKHANTLLYDEQGRVRTIYDLDADGEAQSIRCYNKTGKLIAQIGTKEIHFWHSNGKPAVAVHKNNGITAWDTDGTVLSDEQAGFLMLYLDSLLRDGSTRNHCSLDAI